VKRAIFVNLGLNPGKAFEIWIEKILIESPNKISTINDLLEKRSSAHYPSGLRNRLTGEPITDEMALITYHCRRCYHAVEGAIP
jgi:NTE family protein